jgi:hypothetical protein
VTRDDPFRRRRAARARSDEIAAHAAGLVRTGARYSLSGPRFPGMPLFPGHPPFQVLTYRSPRGIAISGEQPWGPGNEIGLGYMSEMILGSAHSGAHVDALAHMTLGPTGAWHGGCADLHLSDFGPTIGDGREDRLGDPRLQPRHARPPQRLKPSRMLERSSTHQPPETAARHPRSGRFTARRLSGGSG